MPNMNNAGNNEVELLRGTVLGELAFVVARDGASQVRKGTPIFRNDQDVRKTEKDHFWSSIKSRLAEFGTGAAVPPATIDGHVQRVTAFAQSVTDEFKGILYGQRFRLGVAQKLIGLYFKHLWLFDVCAEPAVCPFDRIMIMRVLELEDLNWTSLDDEEMYRALIEEARSHAEGSGFGQRLAVWELFMYQKQVGAR